MKVLVTGGTGFLGSHAVAALLSAGHDVRMFVRSTDKLHRVFDPKGITLGDVVVGDVLDPSSIAPALDGCDAVLHAAGVVGVSHPEGASRRTNVDGTRNVVGLALAAGLDPVVHTSSVAALVPTEDPVLTVDTPVSDPPGHYGRSKAEAERYLRAVQADGAPVVSFLIGAVYGPAQPQLASAMESIVAAAREMMVITSGGIGVIDVRDLARLFTAAMEPGRGPRRYLAGGQYLTWAEWTDVMGEVLGRPVRRTRLPAGALVRAGRLLDAARKVHGFDYPLTYEAAVEMTGTPPNDDGPTLADLGVAYRPVRDTLDDATRWLVEAGHLDARYAPRFAPATDETTDVVVLGFGAAGAAAAIEAADAGARVTVVDRWGGGGATARSGGVVYAGGGTPQQVAAGFADDADAMYAYLRHEEGHAVDEGTLRRFCERSTEDLAWLGALGVDIAPGFDPGKSVVPTDDDVGLYFSGNERQDADERPAVPRGHRVAGRGMTGRDLHRALAEAARRRGVDVRTGVRPTRLLVDDGRVAGVEVLELRDEPGVALRHDALFLLATYTGELLRRRVPTVWRAIERLEGTRSDRRRIMASGGVVIATGGFSFNPEMLAAEAPAYRRSMPLGTAGDDGSGIELGREAGGAVRMMDHCAASRFVAPPVALCEGVLVDAAGARICDESLYAATLSRHIAHHDGRAWLVIDDAVRDRVVEELRRLPGLRGHRLSDLLRGRINHVLFPHLFGRINLYVNRVRAPSVTALAERCGIEPEGLRATIADYGARARSGAPDPMGKAPALVHPLEQGPFTAIPCHLDGWLFPAPTITLGGLDVDGATAAVRRPDGTRIAGLFAAGRAAAGVASRSYVSGLSLADCVFSGRNAGRSAATAARAAAASAVP